VQEATTVPGATDVLRQEHQTIKGALGIAERIAAKINRDEEMPSANVAKLMEFIRLFIEQCHHSKEEEILFPLLEKKGIPANGGPLGVMLMEHERARVLIEEMSVTAGNALGHPSAKRWMRAAWDYSDLMYDHFYKEEEMLFKIADRVLSQEEQAAIAGAFKLLEDERIGPGKHEQLNAMIEELIAKNP
jgi:hemerythrin-like domain-containing protein